MIDKIKINTVINIPDDRFGEGWNRFSKGRSHGYCYKFNDIYFFYSFTTQRLAICGRLINASVIPNRVDNLDMIYVGAAGVRLKQEHSFDESGERKIKYYYESYHQGLPDLIAMLNNKLKELLDIDVDVSKFKVTYIEFCYNVPTEHYEKYISMFNLIFDKREFKRHKNYTLEKKKRDYTSLYIKTKSEYAKANKTPGSYVVDFYNKQDQLQCLIRRAQNALWKKTKEYYNALYQCPDEKYAAKNKSKAEMTLDEFVEEYYKGVKQKQEQKHFENLEKHWFFIPKQWGIDFLESPIKMLDKHISDLEKRRTAAPKRALSAELEASLYKNIEEEDDETYIVDAVTDSYIKK